VCFVCVEDSFIQISIMNSQSVLLCSALLYCTGSLSCGCRLGSGLGVLYVLHCLLVLPEPFTSNGPDLVPRSDP